jgi:tripartite ATP-independent transporter DctM subunit
MNEWLVDVLPIVMLCTLPVLLLSGYPVAFVLAGTGVLFAGIGILLGEFPLVGIFNVPLRVWGSLSGSLVYPAVPILLFMGVALEKSGVAKELLECLQRLLRWVPGNLPVAMMLMGIILAPAAGLVGASVVTLAFIGLPVMLSQGYRASMATGSIAAAGTLGIILPPGVMLFFLAEMFRVPIKSMFVATVVPVLATAALFIVYYMVSHMGKRGREIRGIEPWHGTRGGFALLVMQSLVLPVGLVVLVLASIIAGWATPIQSASVGALGGVIILAVKGRLTLKVLHQCLLTTTMTCAMIFFIIVAATIFSYPFNYFGGPDIIRDFLVGLALSDLGMLLVILAITFVLGFFIDWIEVFVVALPIYLPILNAMDFAARTGSDTLTKLWFAALFALVLQTSFLTPPFGFSLFFVKGAAPPSVRIVEIYRGVVPMVLIQLLMIAAVIVWPIIAIGPAIPLLSR